MKLKRNVSIIRCNELIEDIETLQKNPFAKSLADGLEFLNLCHYKTILEGYRQSDNYPEEYILPSYDFSALDGDHISIEFKHFKKAKVDSGVDFNEDIIEILRNEGSIKG